MIHPRYRSMTQKKNLVPGDMGGSPNARACGTTSPPSPLVVPSGIRRGQREREQVVDETMGRYFLTSIQRKREKNFRGRLDHGNTVTVEAVMFYYV